jgi:outer membrane protein W
MKYKILSLLILLTLSGANNLKAQDDGEVKAKKFSGAILFGRGIYLSEPTVPASPGLYNWTVSGEAPTIEGISSQNDITNMIGVEFRYFVSNKIALKFNGSAIFRNTPARDNVQGVTPATSGAVDSASSNAGWIPNYAATVMDNSLNINVSVGGEYHFISSGKLSPYLGVMIPFCYGRRSMYDPTVTVDMTKSLDDATAVKITDVGDRHIEQIGFGGQLIAGGDYNLSESLFIGLEIKPISYLYAYNIKYPAPGLESRKADTHAWGFFTQPVFKIGFRF